MARVTRSRTGPDLVVTASEVLWCPAQRDSSSLVNLMVDTACWDLLDNILDTGLHLHPPTPSSPASVNL